MKLIILLIINERIIKIIKITRNSIIFDEFNNKVLMEDNINLLTIHDLINVIELRINF